MQSAPPPPFTIQTSVKRALADTVTPVSIYLRLRAKFPETMLLESADYRGTDNSFSYICCMPFAHLTLNNGTFVEELPDGSSESRSVESYRAEGESPVQKALERFAGRFSAAPAAPLPAGVINGMFGYLAFDAIENIEDIKLQAKQVAHEAIPQLRYSVFRYVLAINHFKDEIYFLENSCARDQRTTAVDIAALAFCGEVKPGSFHATGAEESNLSDEAHVELINKCKRHIFRGDVFQIVPSRKFMQRFEGDDFNVYRALRSLNPSPYLFYFDYGSYHIFGSSPEAELVVKGSQASIHPIAGTYRRSGDETEDLKAASRLLDDPKESAEHVMLVDLARNDLSIHCYPVAVDRFKEVQLYSHVIHLVSKVSGTLKAGESSIAVLTSTFPAGTLSGAPKYKALQLIDSYEPSRRHFYGGALGFIGFNGDINHAIMIRSFLSKDGILCSQAGSGIVADSVPETEVAEVRHKLGALKAAVKMAEEL